METLAYLHHAVDYEMAQLSLSDNNSTNPVQTIETASIRQPKSPFKKRWTLGWMMA